MDVMCRIKIRKYVLLLLTFFVASWFLGCRTYDAHQTLSDSAETQKNDSTSATDPDSVENTEEAAVPTASLPQLPGSIEYIEVEPVSNGNVLMYEAGRHHAESILLIHGAGNEGALIWRNIIPELAKQYHVVTFDLPGFGRSSRQNVLYSPNFYAEFIKWVVDRHVLNRPLIVMGHSLGGAVALCYAALYPENLQRLILIDVSGVIHRAAFSRHIMKNIGEKEKGWRKFPIKLFSEIMKNAVVAAEVPESSDYIDTVLNSPDLRNKVLMADSEKIAGVALANFNFSDLIHQIKTPAVIIWGEDDPVTPVRTGKLLTFTLKNTQLNIIPDTGHNIIRERPLYFKQLIQEALVTTSWRSHWIPSQKSDRRAHLSQERNLTLSGYYQNIEIHHCDNILIKNVETEYINVISSDRIVIENSRQ